MNLVKHLGIKCALAAVILLTNFYLGSYISKPFTYADLLAAFLVVSILAISFIYESSVKRYC